MRIQKLIVLTVTLLIPVFVYAQNVKVVNDLRSRSSISVSKGLFNDFEIFSELELGLEENLSRMGKLKGEIGLKYSPFKFLELDAKYRYTKNRKNYSDEYKYTNLFAFSGEAKYKIEKLSIYYRLQYQSIDDESIWDGIDQVGDVFKNRLRFKYNVRGTKITPFIFSEIYVQSETNGFNATKLKTVGGFDYPVSKKSSVKLYYRNDKELTDFMPYSYQTIGFAYNLKFK